MALSERKLNEESLWRSWLAKAGIINSMWQPGAIKAEMAKTSA